MRATPSRIALRTSLLYAAAGVAWILTSDGAMLPRGGAAVDLAMVDLLLPGGVTGLALAAALRGRAPALKVLFTSGYDPEGGHARPLPEGEAFLQKPFTAGALSIAVARALRGTSLPPKS